MAKNKLSTLSIPEPKFLGDKERHLQDQISTEIVDQFIGQTIVYFAIDHRTTNFHPLYGEAIVKNYLPPIRVYCLVEYEEPKVVSTSKGIERDFSINAHFNKRRINEDQGIYVSEGDFLAYGNAIYEIKTVKEPTELWGMNQWKVEVSAHCIKARKGLFDPYLKNEISV